ncbi:hypothetical protein [Acidithiobacillus sp.]|uniref:hypothetical protein n=1 Tax=Acidithiobacillus sp. TaxID=1872118 RepID=UPI0025BB3CE8|nr:hypothetical protein [Acidithiobacillus sp.]
MQNEQIAQTARVFENSVRLKYMGYLIDKGESTVNAYLTAIFGEVADFDPNWIAHAVREFRESTGLQPGEGPETFPQLWFLKAYVHERLNDLDFSTFDLEEWLSEGGRITDEIVAELQASDAEYRTVLDEALAHPERWSLAPTQRRSTE